MKKSPVAGKNTVRASSAKKTTIPAKKTTRAASKTAVRIRLGVDDRRAQLLALGVEAFSQRAYDAVSIEDIAAQAGISRGLLFHYFPSKRDFYVAALEVMAAQMLAETFVQPPAGQSLPELVSLLVRGLDAYFIYVEKRAEAFAALLNAGGDEAQAVVDTTRREFVRRIRAYLPTLPDVDEALLRSGLSGWERMVEGIALDWIEHRDLSREKRVQLAVRAAMALAGASLTP